MIERRALLARGLWTAGALAMPRLAVARAATDRRLVFVIQRGAADGLSIVAPVDDPLFAATRGVLAADFASAPRLGGGFALHPALARTQALFGQKQALFVHAVASPYRDRSHFDGQNVLETGGARAYAVKDGWLNRLLMLLPADGARAIAVAPTVPMALRGAREVSSYAPSALPDASDDLIARVSAMYEDDARLHALWNEAVATRLLTGDIAAEGGRQAAATGALAARLLSAEGGARIATVEAGGWDTHAGQQGRIARQLAGLDALLGALRDGMGALWADTLVIVATEFGRTVAVNGTGGTDHGTASVAWLLGGGVKGGRVAGDFPGLAPSALHDGRDLKPTGSLDAVMSDAIAEHFAIDPARTLATLFPGAATAGAGRVEVS